MFSKAFNDTKKCNLWEVVSVASRDSTNGRLIAVPDSSDLDQRRDHFRTLCCAELVHVIFVGTGKLGASLQWHQAAQRRAPDKNDTALQKSPATSPS